MRKLWELCTLGIDSFKVASSTLMRSWVCLYLLKEVLWVKVLFAVLWFDYTKGHGSACVFWEVLKWPVLLLRAFSSSHTVRRTHNHTSRDDMPNASSGNDLRGLCQLPTAAGRKPEDIRQRTYARSESYLMLCGIDFFATRVSGRKEIDWALQRNFTCLLTRDGPWTPYWLKSEVSEHTTAWFNYGNLSRELVVW